MARKATRTELKVFNRKLILKLVYSGEADSRVELAKLTGLTKPAVSDIVGDLIDEGLLIETGHGESTESGGKRRRLLEFQSDDRQIVGVSISKNKAYGILTNLRGDVLARHYIRLQNVEGQEAIKKLQQAINGLIAQATGSIQGIGIGVPGIVDKRNNVVHSSHILGWHDLPLSQLLREFYRVPVYVGNNTELATRSLNAFGTTEDTRNIVMVLINGSIEVGVTFGGSIFQHSADLGFLKVCSNPNEHLNEILGWRGVENTLAKLSAKYPNTSLPSEAISYRHLYYHYMRGDALSKAIYEDLAWHLAQVFGWITGLLHPDTVILAGDITYLGPPLIELAIEQASDIIPGDLLEVVDFTLAEDSTLSVTGTIALVLNQELGVV